MIKRIITGIVLIAIATFVIIKGDNYLFSFLLLTSICCAYEVHNMNKRTSFIDMVSCFFCIVFLFLSVRIPLLAFLWNPKTLSIIMLFLLLLVGYELSKKTLILIGSRVFFNIRVIAFFGFLFPVIFN